MKIEDVFTNISDDELIKCIRQVKEWSNTGILEDGIVRELSKQVEIVGHIRDYESLRMSEILIYKEASNRWYNIKQLN